ncbi:MAG: ThuA domain-containing protein [Xanthomonadales bacterium]|nr:ThuA domain-containing protein [Xanthomonadales bacterium]
MATARKNLHLVCAGRYHDFDFVRLELLKLFAEHEQVRVSVASDYSDHEALAAADILVTYTSDVIPGAEDTDALAAFLRAGKRWFALHGTNALLRYEKGRGWVAPRTNRRFFEMIGSQFVAHPPIQPFTVRPTADHPLVRDIEPFEADDEIYLCRFFGRIEPLLETTFSGLAPGFDESNWTDLESVPIMYLHPWEDNEVLYLNLGHARGHYDMQPLMDWYDDVERGSWKQPVFHELLRRGIRWSLGDQDLRHD